MTADTWQQTIQFFHAIMLQNNASCDKYLYSKINNQWQTTLHQSSVISMATFIWVLAPEKRGDLEDHCMISKVDLPRDRPFQSPPFLSCVDPNRRQNRKTPILTCYASGCFINCKFSREYSRRGAPKNSCVCWASWCHCPESLMGNKILAHQTL